VARAQTFTLSPAGSSLRWRVWDGIYVVYQSSSAETHVFNETTALILKCLELGSLSMGEVKERTEAALGVDHGQLVEDDFAFATTRLEELGLIDRLDDASATQ